MSKNSMCHPAWNKGVSPSLESRKKMSESTKGQIPYNRDNNTYNLYNTKLNRLFTGQIHILSKLYNIKRKYIVRVINGSRNIVHGWQLLDYQMKLKEIKRQPISDEAKLNMSISKRDKSLYTFINKDTNEEFIGTKYDFSDKYDLLVKGISKLVRCETKSYYRWTLVNT